MNPKGYPCPVCGANNIVNKANVYLKCVSCKAPLKSIKVKKVIKKK